MFTVGTIFIDDKIIKTDAKILNLINTAGKLIIDCYILYLSLIMMKDFDSWLIKQ